MNSSKKYIQRICMKQGSVYRGFSRVLLGRGSNHTVYTTSDQNSSELPVYRKKLQEVKLHFLFPEANSDFRKFTGSRISGCLFFQHAQHQFAGFMIYINKMTCVCLVESAVSMKRMRARFSQSQIVYKILFNSVHEWQKLLKHKN